MMEVAFSDAWTVINEITTFIYEIKIFGNIQLGFFIILIGTLGAVITMIANYKR